MSSYDFKTRTEIKNRSNPGNDKNWVIGYDIGYSAVKLFCANKVAVFPSYARRINENSLVLKEASATDIHYRDKDGTWVVGNLAYENVNSSEVIDSETELFGRNRYYSPMFKVISRTGLAIGLMANSFGNPQGKAIKVQTGLPPKYEKSDTGFLKESLAGHHEFEIRIGKAPWQKFDFTLSEDDVYVMPQPLGSLVSASINCEGKQVAEAKKFFNSDLVIFDPGCGTLDDYTVKNGRVVDYNTFANLGMHEVFARTCEDIYKVYGKEILVPELQNYLETGEIKVTDKKTMKRTSHSFENILEDNCRKVCNEAIEKMKSIHDYFSECDYIIAAGGTYDAWAPVFNEVFKDMDGLKIVPGNVNEPDLSNIYSNVRGYYYFLLNKLK